MLKSFIHIVLFFIVISVSAQDIWAPDPPVLDSVSVDISNISGNVYIGWEPSDSSDVAGYYIYADSSVGDNVIWVLKDTVLGKYTTLYLDHTAKAGYYSEGYRIAAFDYSNNVSLMTPPHYTIYAFPYEQDDGCSVKIKLSWSPYIGWSGVQEYRIYRKDSPTGQFQYIATVSSNEHTYIDEDLQDGVNYCYIVKALGDNGFTSSSNRPCFLVDIPNVPSYIKIANVSTIGENRIEVTVLADENTDGSNKIALYRKRYGEDDGQYKKVATITLKNGKKEYKIIDNTADNVQYRYKAWVYNSCGNAILASNEASNIVMQIQTLEDLQFFLQWNVYMDWESGVDSTYVFRQFDNYLPQIIYKSDVTAADMYQDLSTYDFRSKFYEGKICFYVKFKEKAPSQYADHIYYSQSNKVCVQEFSRVFLPNAFVPRITSDTINSVFKPTTLFIKKAGYYFAVFNRWGEKIFETTNPEIGWDGKDNSGNYVKTDFYVYVLKYVDNNGDVHKKSGIVFTQE